MRRSSMPATRGGTVPQAIAGKGREVHLVRGFAARSTTREAIPPVRAHKRFGPDDVPAGAPFARDAAARRTADITDTAPTWNKTIHGDTAPKGARVASGA